MILGVWARTPWQCSQPLREYYSWGSRQHHHEKVTLHRCPPTLPPSHTPSQQLVHYNIHERYWGVRANLRMTRFTGIHTFYTSREHLDCQKLRVEYPCSVDGTKLCKHHTRPFDQHLLFQAIGKNSEVQSSECALYQRNYAHQVMESG